MSDAERRALELFPPTYTAETWVRKMPDVNLPLRRAYVRGWQDKENNNPDPIDEMAV